MWLAPWLAALGVACVLAACATAWRDPGAGPFRLSYYWIAEEGKAPASHAWPLYGRDCRSVLARTYRAFHHALSREGTGLLRDGRMLNFDSRCPCAAPGHGGSRVCYRLVDRRAYPWGQGASGSGGDGPAPLRPLRSVAVDPAVIPLGTVLFLPELAGRPGPDGRIMDGCVRADDTGRLIRGRRVDLFAGHERWARWLHRTYGWRAVRVLPGQGHCPA